MHKEEHMTVSRIEFHVHKENGEVERHAIGITEDDDTAIGYFWCRNWETKMMRLQGSEVPLTDVHQPMRDFGGKIIDLVDWTEEYSHVRDALGARDWPEVVFESLHPNGKVYTWNIKHPADDTTALKEIWRSSFDEKMLRIKDSGEIIADIRMPFSQLAGKTVEVIDWDDEHVHLREAFDTQ